MHFVRTRSGYGPAPLPRPTRVIGLPIAYYIPTPAWARADHPDAPSMTRTDYVGYRAYLARASGR